MFLVSHQYTRDNTTFFSSNELKLICLYSGSENCIPLSCFKPYSLIRLIRSLTKPNIELRNDFD